MEAGLKHIPDRVSIPLLVFGVILTLGGLSTMATPLAMQFGVSPRPAGEQPATSPEMVRPMQVVLPTLLLLGSGLPAVFTFVLRRKPYAPKLGRISGGLFLIYGLFFPAVIFAGLPFFIPLFFYVIAAIGIWALLKSTQ